MWANQRLLAFVAAAACASSGCMSYVFYSETKHPTHDATLPSVLLLGLVGDAIVATGAAGLHDAASSDSTQQWKDVWPYYGGALFAVDAIVFAAMYSAWKNH